MRQPSSRARRAQSVTSGPDGSVLVRTHPVTYPHDATTPPHVHEWDQLTYAASGVMRVDTDEATWIVPPHRAVWVPAGTRHAEQMFGPVSVRTLYFAPRLAPAAPRACQTLNISALVRELILHVTRLGALDRKQPAHARLIGVLADQLAGMSHMPLQLPMPRDPRAARLAALLQAAPGQTASVATLARRVGASRRTIERRFLAETKMTVGAWRRRVRLLHAVRLLAGAESVTNAALGAGYSSTSAFIAAFRRMFGETPGRSGVREGYNLALRARS